MSTKRRSAVEPAAAPPYGIQTWQRLREPTARLAWLINFTTLDLRSLSLRDAKRVYGECLVVGNGGPVAGDNTYHRFALACLLHPELSGYRNIAIIERADMRHAQETVDAFLRAMATGKDFECSKLGTVAPPSMRGETPVLVFARAGNVIVQRTRGSEGLIAGLLLAAVNTLNELGADRLRICPFQRATDTAPCGRLVVAQRRQQRFCSRQHARYAAWVSWLTRRRRGTRAK